MFNDGFYQNVVIKERFEREGYRPNILHYSSQFYTIRELYQMELLQALCFGALLRQFRK